MTTPIYFMNLCFASCLLPVHMNRPTYRLYIRGLELERRLTAFDYSFRPPEEWPA